MKRARDIFTDEARKRINAAVAEAESKTSAEIVPVVASASGRYDRAEDMAGLFVALCSLIVAWSFFQREDPNAGGWDGPRIALGLPTLVLIIVLGFIAGALAATWIGWLRRLFTSRREMKVEVNAKARQAFFDQRIHHAPGRGGVFIYVSLFERMAVILADDLVIEKLGLASIEEMCTQLRVKLRGEGLVPALEQTTRDIGQRLAPALPRTDGDVNELPNALIAL